MGANPLKEHFWIVTLEQWIKKEGVGHFMLAPASRLIGSAGGGWLGMLQI
jgi:hypothetical protein